MPPTTAITPWPAVRRLWARLFAGWGLGSRTITPGSNSDNWTVA